MRVGLGRDQDTLQAGQGRLALGQAQPERCRLAGSGALTLSWTLSNFGSVDQALIQKSGSLAM